MRKILTLILPVLCLLGKAQLSPHDVLSNYLKYKSVSGNEKAAGVYIEQVCRNLGLYTTLFSDSDSSYNFCASVQPFDPRKTSVILLNHIDVVAAGEGNWRFGPFDGVISDDTLYGRGAIDMKGLAVMQLFALRKMQEKYRDKTLQYNLITLFLSGEESGGRNGAALMIDPVMLKKLNPLVIYGEGGGGLTNVIPGKEKDLCFFVSNAEKKSIWIKLEARVKTRGHGSAAGSRTAHKLLLKAINKIENTEQRIVVDKTTKKTFRELGRLIGGYKGFIIKHFDWWLFKPLRRKIVESNEPIKALVSNSYQLTRMDSPEGPVNQVAQSAAVYYDCRLLPNKSERPLLMKLLFRILDPRIRLTVLDESPNAEPTKLDKHYSYIVASINRFYPEAHVMPVLFPATTDNSYFRSMGVPVYGFLPFRLSESMIESVHGANEKIPVSAVTNGIELYTALLEHYIN